MGSPPRESGGWVEVPLYPSGTPIARYSSLS